MTISTHKIEVYPFSYNKLINNLRKIDIRPYTKKLHSISVGDTIEYINLETKDCIKRKVTGIALFNDFKTLVKMLPHDLIGYNSKEEVSLRIERMYKKSDEEQFGVCALFIEEPQIKNLTPSIHLKKAV